MRNVLFSLLFYVSGLACFILAGVFALFSMFALVNVLFKVGVYLICANILYNLYKHFMRIFENEENIY